MKEKLFDFINTSLTAFHAVQNIREKLVKEGYQEVKESEVWDLKAEHKYFVVRNHSSLIAFTTPNVFTSVQVAATHLDSPAFKIKDNGVIIDNQHIKLNVEKYGGMIASTWFDRPLTIAGRAIIKTKTGLKEQLITIDKDIAMIPNMAIHLNRTINEGHKYNIQKEIMPILGQGEDFSLSKYLTDNCAIEGEIVGTDLFLCNRDKAKSWGINDEFFIAPRIDNLECTFAVIEGLLQSKNEKVLNVAALFDNEEVGSRTKQGADSTFLEQTLLRIKASFGLSDQEYMTMLAKGFMISADNAHALHPNYKELYDQSNHPIINQGIVIKHSANQAYTTDAMSASIFRSLCNKVNIAVQDFNNNSNILGGSTLGNISTSHISLNSVDIGLPQWAMHSAYEIAGNKDYLDLIKVISYYYEHSIEIDGSLVIM